MNIFIWITYLLLSLVSCGDGTTVVKERNIYLDDFIDPSLKEDSVLSILGPQTAKFKSKALIKRGRPLAPSDKRYLRVEVEWNKSLLNFNHQVLEKGTREIHISGKDIVFEAADRQGILEIIEGFRDISHVTIHGENLEINTSVKILGANVEIKAKRLIIGPKGELDLTPPSFETSASQFQNGLDGLKGAQLSLILKEAPIIHPREEKRIFILNGGNGQDAGAGQDGADGVSRRDLGNGIVAVWTPVCPRRGGILKSSMVTCEYKFKDGHPSPPENGKNGLAGGRPGVPGDGGSIRSNWTLPLGSYDLRAGQVGKNAGIYKGGQPGGPNPYMVVGRGIGEGIYTLSAGQDARSPGALKSNGIDGVFEKVQTQNWFNSGYFEYSLKYANDLHKQNQISHSLESIEEILGHCNEALDFEFLDNQLSYQKCQTGHKRHFNLVSNLDFYGHSATWTPNLSFETNYKLFNEEVSRSFQILFMTYWLTDKQRSLEENLSAVNSTQKQLLEEIEEESDKFNSIVKVIPEIKKKLSDVLVKEEGFREELRLLEIKITEEANNRVIDRNKVSSLKKMVKSLASLATVIPVGQPAFGVVANTVDSIVQGIGTDKPLEEFFRRLPNNLSSFKPSVFQQSKNSWNQMRERIDLSHLQNIFSLSPENSDYSNADIKLMKLKYFDDLNSFMVPIVREISRQANTSKKQQVPASEVEKEILKIKNSHPIFNEITNNLKALIATKTELNAEIVDLNSNLGIITNKIGDNFQDITRLSEQKLALSKGNDFVLKEILKQIGDRAKSRLDKYYYLLLKSYQYRMLSNYEGELDLRPSEEKILTLVKANDNGRMTPDEFISVKEIYNDQIAQMIKSIVDEANSGTLFHTQAKRGFRLSENQLVALNSGFDVYIDLKQGDISFDELTEVRINSVEVEKLEFTIEGNPGVIAEGQLTVQHTGSSYFKKANEYLAFDFGDTASKSRLKWGGTKNVLLDSLNPIRPSFSDESLLSALIESDEDRLLFARPGGLTNLKIKLKTKVDNGAKLKLKEGHILINYDYKEI
ncbi:MAG: hypothetical protein K9K67_00600 [Bacteriovoracaceae bacterium]|nr:hypothetical protein [Bacteriovoracaceae bacterium]